MFKVLDIISFASGSSINFVCRAKISHFACKELFVPYDCGHHSKITYDIHGMHIMKCCSVLCWHDDMYYQQQSASFRNELNIMLSDYLLQHLLLLEWER